MAVRARLRGTAEHPMLFVFWTCRDLIRTLRTEPLSCQLEYCRPRGICATGAPLSLTGVPLVN
jgi:hypothetical protein